jgi:tetratricopeptide (TPR) repeat protein
MTLALVLFLVSASRFGEVRQLKPVRLRLANWFQAARVIGVNPVFGCGLGNYATAVSPHVRTNEQPSIYAHNFLLQLSAEIGLPALLLILLLSAAALGRHASALRRPDNAPYTALLLQLLVYNLIDIGTYFFAAGLALVVTLALLLPRPKRVTAAPLAALAILALGLLAAEVSASAQREGDLLLHLQQVPEARRMYQRSLALNPVSWRALGGMAQVCRRLGDAAGERRALERLLEVNPLSASANLQYAQLVLRDGEYLTALRHAAAARSLAPESAAIRTLHETILHRIQDQFPAAGN